MELPQGGYAWASVNEWKLFSGDRNVALNRPATADSQQNGTYAAKANDGDFNSTWYTGKPDRAIGGRSTWASRTTSPAAA